MTDTLMPGVYDRTLAALHGLPDVVKTKPSTIRTVPTLGVGGTTIFVVQTYRQRDVGDTIFLEVVDGDTAKRLVLPRAVADLIARQRDALTGQMRSKSAKANAAERKRLGLRPGFLKKK